MKLEELQCQADRPPVPLGDLECQRSDGRVFVPPGRNEELGGLLEVERRIATDAYGDCQLMDSLHVSTKAQSVTELCGLPGGIQSTLFDCVYCSVINQL